MKYFPIHINTKEEALHCITTARNWNSKRYDELKNLTDKEFNSIEEEIVIKSGINALAGGKGIILHQANGMPKMVLAERIKREFIMFQVDQLIDHLTNKYQIIEELDERRIMHTDKYTIKIRNINDIEL